MGEPILDPAPPYTEAEERFIEASTAVIQAGDAIHKATEQMQKAQLAAKPFGEALNLGSDESGVKRTTTLLLESARRAGFEEDSPVVQSLYDAEAELLFEVALRQELAQAVVEKRNRNANPVI